MSEYIPGTCNINRSEIAYRKKAGYAGLAIFIVAFIALYLLVDNQYIRVLLFIPAFIAAIGFLQAKNSFCVAYGAAGQQNATDGGAAAIDITEDSAKAADKKRARELNTQAFIYAIIATAIAVLVPSL